MEYTKLNIALIGGNCGHHMDICFNAIPDEVNKIIFVCDTTSKDDTLQKAEEWKKKWGDRFVLIKRDYEHDSPYGNGRARNVYLQYLQEHHDKEWCLVLDPDEILSDNCLRMLSDTTTYFEHLDKGIRKELNTGKSINIPASQRYEYDHFMNVRMEHFIRDLRHVDRTLQKHYAPYRMFMVSKRLTYPEVEHPVLTTKKEFSNTKYLECNYDAIILWHLAYASYPFDVLRRYKSNMKKSNIHSEEFLKTWLHTHAFGYYPVEEIDINMLPTQLKKEFMVSENIHVSNPVNSHYELTMEEFYVFFKTIKDKISGNKMLDVGCRDSYHKKHFKKLGLSWKGIDLKPDTQEVDVGDMNKLPYDNESFDLIFCCHSLEHNETPIQALREMHRVLKPNGWIFISMPSPCKQQIIDGDDDHISVLTPDQLLKLLKYTGFEEYKTKLQYENITMDRNYNVLGVGMKGTKK